MKRTLPDNSILVTSLLLAAGWMVGGAGTAWAQERISSIRISTEPFNAYYLVDGVFYQTPTTFFWPAGSKHTVRMSPVQEEADSGKRVTFLNWSDSTGLLASTSPEIVVTADPAVTYLRANVRMEYAVWLVFNDCRGSMVADCGRSSGTVEVNSVAHSQNVTVFFPANSTITVRATPNAGLVFSGWGPGLLNSSQAFVTSFQLTQPTTLYPQFSAAAPITLQTSPAGLKLLADRTPVQTPVTLDWGMESRHSLGPVSPQYDMQGQVWVFSGWSEGQDEHHTYTVPGNTDPQVFTCSFVRGQRVTFLTTPGGLKLNIDGRDNWAGYNFTWGRGTRHVASAPQTQLDARGRGYIFTGWSNGAGGVQEVIVPDSDLRLTAHYEPLARIAIQSTPPGIFMMVDGQECLTPCKVDRPAGTSVRIAAPASVQVNEGTRLEFTSWRDDSAAERETVATTEPQVLEASYRYFHRLAQWMEPGDAGRWVIQPASPDRFFEASSVVSVHLEPNPGYRFLRWEGDMVGSARPGSVFMDRPKLVRAVLEELPTSSRATVQNAAAVIPEEGVAPGSLISIFGSNLAPGFMVGPASPLAQTLADVTVRVASRALPLFFVSPEQINAQLLSDLPEGKQSMTVKWEGRPDVNVEFTILRNAPGLFRRVKDDKAYAFAFHESEGDVTAEKPARRNEAITVLGTGFGPYTRPAFDGFALPAEIKLQLADAVEVLLGDAVLVPEFSGAAAGQIGVNAVRFRIPEGAPANSSVELRVRINGRVSNTVLLPLE